MKAVANREYLKVARAIIDGKLPLKTTAISPGQWEKAQEIVGRTLGASNETYIHPRLLYGLCEHIADGLNHYLEMGVKAAGGIVVEIKK